MLERVGYLKEREEIIAVRRTDQSAEFGFMILYQTLYGIVSRRIYQTHSTRFDSGINVSEEQYAINVKGKIISPHYILSGDQVVLGRPSNGDDLDNYILTMKDRVLNVKSVGIGVYLTRLNCVEL